MYSCDSDPQQAFSRDQASAGQFSGSSTYDYRDSYSTYSHPSSSGNWGYSSQYTPPAATSRGYVAVSMVTVDVGHVAGDYGRSSIPIPMVARVTLVDHNNAVLLDTYVQPTHRITNYRTEATGLSYIHFQGAPTFDSVQRTVAKLIYNNIIVGHRLWEFLSVMGLSHPALDTRDLCLFRPLRKRLKSRCIIELRILVRFFVGREIGLGYEDSFENAVAAMDLYGVCYQLFERTVSAGGWPCDLPPVSHARHYT